MLKIGVQTLGWYRAEDPLGSFEYVKSCGFDAVDFNIDQYFPTEVLAKQGAPYTSVFDKSVEELLAYFKPLKDAAEQTGVEICQMHAPFPVILPGMDELNACALRAVEKSLYVCQYVGCPAIVVHPVKGNSLDEEWEINTALYRKLIPAARATGVKICLENLFTHSRRRLVPTHLADVSPMCRMLDQLNEEAGADCFGFCFDIGHACICAHDAADYVRRLGKRLTILHLHDNDGREDLHMAPYSHTVRHDGVTVCDWDGFVAAVAEIDYRGVLCFETFAVHNTYPAAVRDEVMRLISAIGRTWAAKIDELKQK